MGITPYDLYDSLEFIRVFFPGGLFHAAVEIYGIGRDGPDGFFNIAFMEAARQDQRIQGFDAPGQIPVGLLARPPVASGLAMVQQDRLRETGRSNPAVHRRGAGSGQGRKNQRFP
jgi:hypothetical protein